MATATPPKPKQPAKKPAKNSNGNALLIGITAVMVVIGIAVIVMFTGSDTPAKSTTANNSKSSEFQDVKVTGSLSSLPDSGTDADIGKPAPTATGKNFAGDPVTLIQPGKPTMIVFAAHWCPHCNAELPLIIDWMKSNGNKDVDVIAVTTGSDVNKPNWPPSSWLANLGWGGRVLADSKDQTLAQAYGLTGYPYMVFVDAKGNVSTRFSGERPISDIDAAIAKISTNAAG